MDRKNSSDTVFQRFYSRLLNYQKMLNKQNLQDLELTELILVIYIRHILAGRKACLFF